MIYKMKFHLIADCTLSAENIEEAQRKLGEWLISDSKAEQSPSPLETGNLTLCPWGEYRPNHTGEGSSCFIG